MTHVRSGSGVHAGNVGILLTVVCTGAFVFAEEPKKSSQVPSAVREADHDRAIEFFLKRIEKHPQGAANYVMLARRYLRKAREAGDESCYAKAEAALREAVKQEPENETAQLELAGVLCTRHRFADGLKLAEEILEENPDSLDALVTIFDAQLELGRYKEAEATLTTLAGKVKSVGPALQARQAHLAELKGQPDDAIALMQLATEAMLRPAGDQITPGVAWYPIRLGHLYLDEGRLEDAAKTLEPLEKGASKYFLALAAVAELRTAQERWDDAIAAYEKTIALAPDPIFYMALGDIYVRLGQQEKGEATYAKAEETLLAENADPGEIARELSLFYSERDRQPEKALELALIDLQFRQDVWGHDAHAWALYRKGKLDEAHAACQKAMQLGTRSAKLHYHAGMIAHKRGDQPAARRELKAALDINPRFGVLTAVEARRTLAELGDE